MLTEWLRIYVVVVSLFVMVVGTMQWRRFLVFIPENQLAWLSIAALNLAIGVGTLESFVDGAPGGVRNYLIAVAMTWLLAAVCYRPFLWAHLRWRAWRKTQKEIP